MMFSKVVSNNRVLGFVGAVLLGLLGTQAFAEPLDVFRDCDACPDMVELPMGSFLMGAPPDEMPRDFVIKGSSWQRTTKDAPHRKHDEGPQHTVTIDIPIAMGRTEVTHDQWMSCVNDGGCGGYAVRTEVFKLQPRGTNDHTKAYTGGSHPVIYVSFLDAQAYVTWLNEKLNTDAYRLPTEVEWEYAARAGTTTRFAQGNDITSDQVAFSKNATEFFFSKKRPDLRWFHTPVRVDDLDAANAWGLRHMSGNVTEITLSCYTKRYAGWAKSSEWLTLNYDGDCPIVLRGGSYHSPTDSVRVAWRARTRNVNSRIIFSGFRIAKEIKK